MREKENIDRMRFLVERFMDGATTNGEEQELYELFRSDSVPADLRKLRPMFAWYAGGMQAPLPVRRPLRRRLFTVIGVAAAVLLLFGAGLSIRRHMENERMYEIYAGSYVIRGGKKITDLRKIMPELQRNADRAERICSELSNGTYAVNNETNIPTI